MLKGSASSVQVLLQIFACVNFLSLLGGTFLFRSGLFVLLYKQFRAVFIAMPAYTLFTIVLAFIRLVRVGLYDSPLSVEKS